MAEISERPPALHDDDTEDDPTRVASVEARAALESNDDSTLAGPPPSIRGLGLAPPSKPIAPLPPMVPPVVERIKPIEPIEIEPDEPDGDATEVGLVARLVSVAAKPDRDEQTAKLPVVPVAAPAPAEPPPSSRSPRVEEDPVAELLVPGLGPDARAKWLAIAALALVMVWIGGAAVGRMSAPRTDSKPAASSAMPSNDVPVPVAEPSTSNDEPAPSATLSIAPERHVTPPERRGVVRAPPPRPPPPPPPVVRSRAGAAHTGGIVRETPF